MANTTSFVSGKTLYLATKLTPAGTLTVTTDPGIDTGRIYLVNDNQVEWINFTSVAPSGSYFELGGLTRDIDPDSVPMASLSTGKTWLATQKCLLVAMHDQLIDRNQPTQLKQEALTYATTAARDAALGGDGVCTYNYTDIKVTATGLFYNYNTTSGQWEVQGTGTATPNASTTVSGSVEIATTAESKAGTDTGGTGAYVSVLPSDIAANTQSGTFVYAASADVSDTYTCSLTPALTAYTTGMKVRVKFTTANTGACTLNVNSLGAKSIKLVDGSDPLDGDIAANDIAEVVYDGTNFVLQNNLKRASTSDATTGTDTVKFMTPSTTKDSIEDSIGVFSTILNSSSNSADTGDTTAATSGFVTISVTSSGVSARVTATLTYGAASPSSTIAAVTAQDSSCGSNAFSFPVKKGYHYRVLSSGINSTNTTVVYFTPSA